MSTKLQYKAASSMLRAMLNDRRIELPKGASIPIEPLIYFRASISLSESRLLPVYYWHNEWAFRAWNAALYKRAEFDLIPF